MFTHCANRGDKLLFKIELDFSIVRLVWSGIPMDKVLVGLKYFSRQPVPLQIQRSNFVQIKPPEGEYQVKNISSNMNFKFYSLMAFIIYDRLNNYSEWYTSLYICTDTTDILIQLYKMD